MQPPKDITFNDFADICRFCLTKSIGTTPTQLIRLFDDDGTAENQLIMGTIRNCLGFQKISPYDGMPQSYCTKCMKALQTCSSFRRLCAISAQQLQTILKERIRQEKNGGTKSMAAPASNPTGRGQVVMELEIEQVDDAPSRIPDNDEEYFIDYIDTKYEVDTDSNGEFELQENTSNSQLRVAKIEQYEGAPEKHQSDNTDNVYLDENEMDEATYYDVAYDDSEIVASSEVAELEIKDEPGDLLVVDECDEIVSDGSLQADTSNHSDSPKKPLSKKGRRKNGEKELCPDCGGFFISLKNHLQTHRDKNRRKCYNCDQCDAKFVNKASYVGHVNKHNNVTPFQCPQCPRSFHGKGNLRMHMNSHSTVNRYACTECNKAFRYSHMLALHRRSHTLERVYFCEFCNYCSVNRENYKNHLMNHTGVYRFNCDKCTKGFKKRIYYMKHMKTHELITANA